MCVCVCGGVEASGFPQPREVGRGGRGGSPSTMSSSASRAARPPLSSCISGEETWSGVGRREEGGGGRKRRRAITSSDAAAVVRLARAHTASAKATRSRCRRLSIAMPKLPPFQWPKINLGDSQNFSQKCFGFFDNISIGSIDGNGSATGRSRALLEGGRGGGLAEGLRNNRVAGALLKSDGRATEATGARYERMAARTGKASGRSALGGVMFLLVSVAVFAPAADAFKERDVIDSVMATIRNRAANQGHEQPNTLDELAGALFGYIPSDDASSRPRLTPLTARSRTLYLSRARANRDAQSSDPTCSRPSGLSSRRTEPRTSSPRSSS